MKPGLTSLQEPGLKPWAVHVVPEILWLPQVWTSNSPRPSMLRLWRWSCFYNYGTTFLMGKSTINGHFSHVFFPLACVTVFVCLAGDLQGSFHCDWRGATCKKEKPWAGRKIHGGSIIESISMHNMCIYTYYITTYSSITIYLNIYIYMICGWLG